MFVLRYKHLWKNIEAIRRMDIIKLKNTQSYDPVFGAITMTYFPINLILLPFLVPLILLKSERLNDSILKLQYLLMSTLYIVLAIVVAIPVMPLLYFKIIVNAIYIMFNNKREKYPGQNMIGLMLSMFMSPLFIVLSMLIDVVTLNS